MSQKKRSTVGLLTAALAVLLLVPQPMLAADSGSTGDSGNQSSDVSLDEAVELAIEHLEDAAVDFGVTAEDVSDVFVMSAYRSSHNRITHVNLNQSHEGLEVFSGHATVNITADGLVAFAAGTLVGDVSDASGSVQSDAIDAVEAAADALDLDEPEDLRLLRRVGGPARETLVSDGGISEEPIPVRLGYQPTKDGLRLAWNLVIDDASDVHLWNAAVDAETGDLLNVDDWTIVDDHDDLEATLKREDGAVGSAAANLAEGSYPPDPVIDGSSYRVFDIPKESPNDAGRSLIENPADSFSSPFGWHSTDGSVVPEFTITRGNNVHAYLDQDHGQAGGTSNAPDFGFDVDGGPGLTFDFPADLDEHAQNYRDAVVTNLFYWNNIVHDIHYRYGFTEESGNFQAVNYVGGPTAGGGQGDYVRAEAADGGGTNNANFSTPATAGTPRMQMYLWPGNQFGSQNQVVVDGVGDFGGGWARFSPAPSVAGTSGALFDAGNGCTPLDYVGAPSGDWIAIVTGNNTVCQNIAKVRQAEAAGAGAAIVAHTTGTTTPILTGPLSAASPAPNIPVVSANLATGNEIRDALPATGTVRKHPNHPGIRDGDFEAGIIIHEYSHGISNRLTGGPGINCLGSGGNQQQMGEGWSDWHAIAMLLDPALDDPEGPRGMGPYALFQDSRQGNGIRPRPYSRNMEIQPGTFDSIKTGGWLNGATVSQPHGIGHVWAAILWDATWDLVEKHGFNPNLYDPWFSGGNNRIYQYVNDGLKLQGCGPTFVVGRAAIVEAANILGGGDPGEVAGDACTLWAAFARRGLGFSATSPTGNRNAGTEAFDTHPDCLRGFQAPIHGEYGELNEMIAGDVKPLRFHGGGGTSLDILASNSPFSRRVDCDTLQVPSQDPPFITPREFPIPTSPPGKSGLSVSSGGVYRYNWQTSADWAGTCRELVLTRKDGKQHRAFFQFV